MKITNIISADKDTDKLEYSYIADGNIKYCSHFKKQSGSSPRGEVVNESD